MLQTNERVSLIRGKEKKFKLSSLIVLKLIQLSTPFPTRLHFSKWNRKLL